MTNSAGRAASICLLAALILAAVSGALSFSRGIRQLSGFVSLSAGHTLLVTDEENSIRYETIDAFGKIQKSFRVRRNHGKEQTSVCSVAADDSGLIYAIENIRNQETGENIRQELAVYDFSRIFRKERGRFLLDHSDGTWYRWISAYGPIMLMGTDSNNTTVTRLAIDEKVLSEKKQVSLKSVRKYPVQPGEGIYQVIPAGNRIVYLSYSGKTFVSAEGGKAVERYPARVLDRLTYPMYLFPNTDNTVLIGEQDSGNILSLNIDDGSANILRSGSEPYAGTNYTAANIVGMSMQDTQNYTAVFHNGKSGLYDLVVCRGGECTPIEKIRQSVPSLLFDSALRVLLGFLSFMFLIYIGRKLFSVLVNSRTILVKLLSAAVPLLVIGLVLFGWYSYTAFQSTMEANSVRKVQEEGNLLSVMMSSEDFHAVEFPYDYGNDAYNRLSAELKKRPGWNRTAYYENGRLSTGIAEGWPCFYPLDITLDSQLTRLYQQAAVTGLPVHGTIRDKEGKRLTCITPVGGLSGNIVYLIETGSDTGEMERQSISYLRSYCLTSSAFLVAVTLFLLAAYSKLLEPIGSIKSGMESFFQGDHSVRLQSRTNDELADICRVFNQMANDIDSQLYHLRTLTDTYYRFIPQRIFQLLGKDNLGELDLGSHVEKQLDILSVHLYLKEERLGFSQSQEITNHFFEIINSVSGSHQSAVLIDRMNLREIKILCSDGEAGVQIALLIIAKIDSYNAVQKLQNRLEVSFLLHSTEAFFGICGDNSRYVPALISQEMEYISEKSAQFRMLSNRLTVTSDAFQRLDPEKYFYRFIGYIDDSSQSVGLYDFYDGTSPEITRLLNSTKGTFDKAMELYQQRRYYDAKSLFAIVLRENQYDNVSRYYIFQCEQYLN